MCKLEQNQNLTNISRETERQRVVGGREKSCSLFCKREINVTVQIGPTHPKGLGEEEREREREINKTYKGRIHAKNLEMLTGPCYLFEAYCNPLQNTC
jgi:hypothetical protein